MADEVGETEKQAVRAQAVGAQAVGAQAGARRRLCAFASVWRLYSLAR